MLASPGFYCRRACCRRAGEPNDVDALLALLPDAVTALTHFEDAARIRVRQDRDVGQRHRWKRALHGLAWLATTFMVSGNRRSLAQARRVDEPAP